MISIHCCKDCPDRHVGCHATCETYIKEKKENDEMKQRVKDSHKIDIYKSGKAFERRNKQLRKYGKSFR